MIGLPAGPQLQQNAPNPFNSETVISWFLLEPGLVRVEVFALTGQRLAVLHGGPLQAGFHLIHEGGRDDAGHALASGVYPYRLVSHDRVVTPQTRPAAMTQLPGWRARGFYPNDTARCFDLNLRERRLPESIGQMGSTPSHFVDVIMRFEDVKKLAYTDDKSGSGSNCSK